MRLPDTVNTKPQRGGALVHIIEIYLERRYPLAAFERMVTAPKPEKIGRLNMVTLTGNGQHLLPVRTEHYLTSGATNGQRNEELFAAACQLRDAGHSQAEAERELVARYLADGNGNENQAAREKEARATIRSAYSQLPREPIQSPAEAAKNKVRQLVGSYTSDQRPTAEQIAEAVQACAHLNAVEWAEERQHLKSVCGDNLRLVDPDRLYRQTHRELERSQKIELPSSPHYIEVDGHIVFEKISERGTSRQMVAEWSGRVVEWITQVNDDGQGEHVMRLELRQDSHMTTLDVPSELFGDPNALGRFIALKAGGIYTVCAGMNKHLPSAILKLSGQFPTRQTYRFLGWTQIDNQWVYVSPGMSIGASGKLVDPPDVELESRLRDYGLCESNWNDSLRAFTAAIAVFPKTLAPTLIAFALLLLLQRFFPAAAPKPALHLVGTTGSGKSEIAALMGNFYGQFSRDTPPAQWGDTVNTVEALGYPLADCLYWVDDFKPIYTDERTFTRLLQSYSRGMGRGRLTREAKLRQERPCRGHLLSTGEATIEGEASVLTRMLVLEIPPWKQRDSGGAALAQAEALRQHLPGFTAHFIRWIATQANAGTLAKELAERFVSNTQGYQAKLSGRLGDHAHTGRMEQNWAVLVSVYQILSRFVSEMDADYLLPGWKDSIFETVQLAQQERAGKLFLNILTQQLASARVMLGHDMRNPEEPRPGTTIIGYQDDKYIYLLPEVAYQEVTRGQPLKFSPSAIGAQLKEDGWLIPGTNSLTVQRRVRGIPTRFWQLKADFIEM